MRADEILRRYAEGEKNFCRVNLKGQSFKGKNLSGADFTRADIRGADFTNAILIGTSFRRAKAGLQRRGVIGLVIASLMLSALSGIVATLMGWFAGNTLIVGQFSPFLSNLIILITLIAVHFFIIRKGLVAGMLTALAVAVPGTVVYVWGTYVSVKPWADPIGRVAVAITWVTAGTVFEAAFSAVFGAAFSATLGVDWCAIFGAAFGAATAVPALVWLGTVVELSEGSQFRSLAVAVTGALVGGYISWQVLTGENKNVFVRRIALAFAATGGTSFRGSNLTNADFTRATLKSTNLSNANLNHTRWTQAKRVDQARVSGTILINLAVQKLAITGKGEGKSFAGLNLRGANLVGAKLRGADLTDVDLGGATLQGACLEGANLTKTQALGTNFDGAKLTGACLESWNIDSTTQLNGAICDYVYLQNDSQERRPSSGEFAPEDFAKLFQEVLSTVDLILRNGVDWKAFTNSFKKLQVENEGIELSVRSIENKGDGVIVVKVNVPAGVNKAKLHSDLTQSYEFELKALEERYQEKLKSKDEQIAIIRQHQADQQEVLKMLISRRSDDVMEGKLVLLEVEEGDFKQGFPVTLRIAPEGTHPFAVVRGRLPPAPEILEHYSQWQSVYRRSMAAYLRIKVSAAQVTNFSNTEFINDCNESAEVLRETLNSWLNSESFRPIRERLLEKLTTSESIRAILLTDNPQLRRLPWHLWDFFERYFKAEIALSTPVYERVEKLVSPGAKVRILVILGNSTGIAIQEDRKIFEQLPDAEVNFLVEPQRGELDNELWSQPWDILFFAGHSSSYADGKDGQIYINQTDSLTIAQLKYALRQAISQSLKLAIFNSCDGLGLAGRLADLQIPQIIVMREPVPDRVAQEFLKNFLEAFAGGKSLYLSVREAREKLQWLENEFPCATWLPVICQNPAEVPKIWQEFRGV